jgi:hypothetical protein
MFNHPNEIRPPESKHPGADNIRRDECRCTTSLAQGDDRCHKCGKLLRELPKKAGAK